VGRYQSLLATPHSAVAWGLLMVGMVLSAPYAWRSGKAVLVNSGFERALTATGEVLRRALAALVASTSVKLLLGPGVGLLVWCLPLDADPMAHKALAIMAFLVMYWITEPLDYGVTALLGCYLFWTLGGMKFSVAFSGFASSTPWFVLGMILLGQAAATTGLAERLGLSVIRRIGVSSGKVLFGLLLIVWMLSFLIPSPNALLAILAPLAIGIITTLGVSPQSNTAKGLFVGFSIICDLMSKSLLGSGGTAFAYGIIAEQTGIHIWWSQWLVAFLPASILSIVVCYLAVRWLYPPEVPAGLAGGHEPALAVAFPDPGAWTQEQKKTLAWMLLAIVLWATDFLHHLDPAYVAIGVGLGITLPRIGVLDTKAFKQTNFLLIFFIAGALSMSRVLADTHAIDTLMESFTSWTAPLLTNAWSGSMALYWSAFFYHFGFAGDQVLAAATLSPILGMATSLDYNPVTIGMLWTFATGAKLFVCISLQ
jgi:anion transporter